MKNVSTLMDKAERPIRVVQFGTGNFLRAFADWMLEIVNEKTDWNGSVVMAKSTGHGSLSALKGQDCVYTVALRGLENGAPVGRFCTVTCVSDVLVCSAEYDRVLALAKLPELRFVLSNTTEAGIAWDERDEATDRPPRSFPAKLTQLLYARAQAFDYAGNKGLIMLPMELIDDNGGALRTLVVRYAEKWALGERFLNWLDESCTFASTLVDRIVTGKPADAAALCTKLGVQDDCLVAAEPYMSWVIACDREIEEELPLQKVGLPVIYAQDLAPYRTRKVRLLNGAHTSFVPAAYLAGFDIVRDAVLDPDFGRFIRKTLEKEILPTIDQPEEELRAFANSVLERFANPYIDHSLLAICLNSVSKWRARILPTLLDDVKKNGEIPQSLTFSLAALLELYSGKAQGGEMRCLRGEQPYVLRDEDNSLRSIEQFREDLPRLLAGKTLWGMNLNEIPDFAACVAHWRERIRKDGVQACIGELGA